VGHADEAAAALQAVSDAMTVEALPGLQAASEAAKGALGHLASAGDKYAGGEMAGLATQIDEHIHAATQLASLLAEKARSEAGRLQAGG
jgi:hypothetical protein